MGLRCSLVALIGLVFATTTFADDWPQWLGPQRDGVWREDRLINSFPKDGLRILWRVPVAGGYAGPAVANGRVFVTDHVLKQGVERPKDPFAKITQSGTERVLCIDEKSGKVLWTHEYDCPYSLSYSAGPRTTPSVDGDRVSTLGAEGDLFCFDAASGRVIWSKHLSSEKSPTPTWGFAAHPLIDGDKLIVLSCGNDPAGGHGLVSAYDKMDGKMLWTALAGNPPGYSPPMMVNAGGTRQLIVWYPESVNSLNPETGKLYWTQPFGPVKNGVAIATPRFYHDRRLGDLLFISDAYDGGLLLKLDPNKAAATVLWNRKGKSERKTEALHILMSPPTIRDGHVYGVCFFGQLRCLDASNGDRLWETFAATTGDAGEQMWANAFLIPIGDSGSRYLIANDHGDLILANLSPQGYVESSRTHLLDPTNSDAGRAVLWCHPALANRCIFWRNDKELVCASLAGEDVR